MSSVSGRFLVNVSTAVIQDAVKAAFGDAPHPLYEVDAHVLRALAVPLTSDFDDADHRVMELVTGRLAESIGSPSWMLYLTDAMTGPEPLAVMLMGVELQQVQACLHCSLVISELKQLRRPPSLPYDLRRVAARSVSQAFWSTIESSAAPLEADSGEELSAMRLAG